MSSNGPKDKQIFQRSLVGMTMGARKRAARRDAMGVRTAVHDFRTSLRIGHKLRPCPGCALCQPCAHCGKPSTCIGLYEPLHETQKPTPACDECCAHGCEDGHCELRADDENQCNGSGVLPARKAKR